MKIKDIYEKAFKRGMELDPRAWTRLRPTLQGQRNYDELKDKDKPYFDIERLKNPYSDTRILFGDPDKRK